MPKVITLENLQQYTEEIETRLGQKQDTLTFDSAPTSGSTNPVTSGGVYDALPQGDLNIEFNGTATQTTEQLNNVVVGTKTYTMPTVDAALSTTSANAVRNSAITVGINASGHSIALSMNSSTYVLTLQLKDANNNVLSTQTVDLPLESVVVNGSYDNTNKRIVLTLQNGTTINVPVGDLVAGLVPVYTSGSTDWDTTPTSGSTKPVTSGGVYAALPQGDLNVEFNGTAPSGATEVGLTNIVVGDTNYTVSFDTFTNTEIDSAMFGTYTVTGSVTNGTATSATIIARTSATATITITPDTGYTLPATITVTNATLTSYDDTTGIVTVSNPSDNVVVTAVCEAISYTIATSVTNGTYSGATSIAQGGTATVTIVPNSTYTLPSTITVSGATYSYNSTSGVISLSNPTVNVTITAVCESAQTMPVKGQIITMTLGNSAPAAGTNNTYRVLKVNGTQAEVVAMFDQVTSRTFDDGMDNTYAGSDLDIYLTNWYNGLNADAKSAIVAKSVQQYQYSYLSSVYNATTHASYADYSTKATKGSTVSKYVYALDVEDIETYFGGTFSTADIWTLFWNTTSRPSSVTYPWLRSARAVYSDSAFYVNGYYGFVSNNLVGTGGAARPAFTIDLSKISWA